MKIDRHKMFIDVGEKKRHWFRSIVQEDDFNVGYLLTPKGNLGTLHQSARDAGALCQMAGSLGHPGFTEMTRCLNIEWLK